MFSEVIYYLFLAVVALGYRFVGQSWRSVFLATAGMAFYTFYAKEAIFLLVGLTVLSWFLLFPPDAVKKAVKWHDKPAVHNTALVIVISLAVLGFFKYSGFIAESFGVVNHSFPAAPLAISFFVFEFVHVAAEKRKGTITSIGFADYFSFIFFFPTMVAGPIKRYDQFSEYTHAPKVGSKDVLEGSFRIILGLLKKAVLADNINSVLLEIGSPDKTSSPLMLSAAVVLYGFRIWLDFSGYSDVAIGSARLFGIKVPENFLQPYLQRNIALFWRHWHVSLSSWLTQYVYIPLGGSRKGLPRQLVNLMIVMLVSGIWHGAAWNFVVWGAWHGVLLCSQKLWELKVVPKLPEKLVQSWASRATSYVLTMICVWFGWMLFMWPMPSCIKYLQIMLGGL